MNLPLPRLARPVLIAITLLGLAGATRAEEKVDVVIYGATPGGIATALRSAREGLKVVLIHHHHHVGGMMANGLGVMDTMYDGYRAPIFEEFKAAILAHYGNIAPKAQEYRKYEPHVAERLFEKMLAGETNITVKRELYPVGVTREGRLITSVTFRKMKGEETATWQAGAFVDSSYEGDLAQVAGAAMTVGRESREQYGEPHAGHIFTKMRPVTNLAMHREEGLNIGIFPLEASDPLPGSTGKADQAVQAYNFRVCWTRDPANRLPVTKPARYEREIYLDLKSRWRFTNRVPNFKTSWNAPLLIGGNFEYPAGNWATRQAISERHRDLAIGLLWFLQNDDAVPAGTRQEAREWGLPKDEFQDNGGFPWEMYARETRRLVGRQIFTEHDGVIAPGLRRAPIASDSIAITEWPLDSHSCTTESAGGSDHEGKVLLAESTRPGQISYRCLLPNELDNLLVTVCVSSSHIGWGTLRLEPVWMHLGESAGYALALAKERKIAPANLASDVLGRHLVARRVMVSFFNEFDMKSASVAQQAAQFFGTKGFFSSYHARLDAPLTQEVAAIWATPDTSAMATALRVAIAETNPGPGINAAEFAKLVGRSWPQAPRGVLSRGDACAWLLTAPTSP